MKLILKVQNESNSYLKESNEGSTKEVSSASNLKGTLANIVEV